MERIWFTKAQEHGAIVTWDAQTGYATVNYNGQSLQVKSTADNNRDGHIYVDNALLDQTFGWTKFEPVEFAENSLSKEGPPNTIGRVYNPDGSVKQERKYGSDGLATRDRDYNHSGNMEFPHDHVWVNGHRSEDHIPVPESEKDRGLEIVVGIIGLGFFACIGIKDVPLYSYFGV